MLVLSRRPEESITVGNGVVVKVLEIRGDKVRLGFEADKDVRVMRTELLEREPKQ